MHQSIPLLATKLYLPPARPNIVSRPRLIERLNAGIHRKLTLIAAPAGFGKTTLLSEWLNPKGAGKATILPPSKVAWLSLDEGDNDPTRFLAYLVAALQTVAPQIGAGVAAALQSPQETSGRAAMLTALLNDITTLSNPCVLVLDDYHVIDAGGPLGAVDQMLTFLVEHLPPQMHLVIATREDPPLPLARLRARSQMTELRAADLRFTPAEAAGFLTQVMGLTLSAQDVATLEERTEGWIAGLQLAALSLQDHQDIPSFIQTFAGDHRYILDYLVEEVLRRQPTPVRNFLLQTAILDRLHGPLCDAVTEQQGGSTQLEALERGNFFVVPLDNRRHWYRYHHLFADVLQSHLQTEQPDQVAILHRRASAWYAQQGWTVEAIHHALAAEAFALAADLIELAFTTMRQRRQEATLLGWLKRLPEAVVDYRPVLSTHYAGTLLQSGEFTGVEERLRAAEQWLHAASAIDEQAHPPTTEGEDPQAMIVVDREEFRRLPSWLAIYRAGLALVRGNVQATLSYAQRALDLITEEEHFGRGAAVALLGLAYWTRGELEAAHQTYAEGMANVQKAGYLSDAIGGALALADIRIAQGRLREARRTYEQALQLATAQHPDRSHAVLRGTADMYVGMSELDRERNELATARQYLQRSQALGEHMGFPQHPYRWRVAMARIKEAEGDLDGALALLQEAERLYVSDFYPNVRPLAALKTRVWLAQGRLGEALDWVRGQGLSTDDDLSYLREFDHMTLARVLIARHQHNAAEQSLAEVTRFLERLLQAAEAGRRTGRMIEILLLLALADQAQGNSAAACPPLARALTLAEPEGYIRIFVDEGEAMQLLLSAFGFWLAQQPPTEQNKKLSLYADRLLAALGNKPAAEDEAVAREQHQSQMPKAHSTALVEPLSDRELEVLRLFKTELSGPEIAQQLVIGLSTVRTHTKSIFRKLDVNHRRAAVNRATELKLI